MIATPDEAMLKIEDLHKHFPIKKDRAVYAVNGVDFSITKGETLGLVGESGCGKTTVGRCAVRLIDPTRGKIFVEGKDLSGLSVEQLRKLRSDVQIVFQDPYGSLNPRMVVREIVEDPLVLEGKLDKGERRERVKEVLEMVELGDDLFEKYPAQLTQGEQQRVGVARALATSPKVIVLDEPTSLLDIRFRGEIVFLLRRLQKELGITYLFISHDLVVISQLSHRIAVMYLGRIVEESSTEAVFTSPAHPYTRALFAASLFPDPDQKRGEFLLTGEVPSPVNLPDDRCNLAPRCPLVKPHCYESLPQLEQIKEGHFVACFEAENRKESRG
jgi:oligopeptide/dipeptide ABC transporter ATP-binding protein